MFIYNNFQNPMGACASEKEMQEIADFCVSHNLWVLSDEAYFDIVYGALIAVHSRLGSISSLLPLLLSIPSSKD